MDTTMPPADADTRPVPTIRYRGVGAPTVETDAAPGAPEADRPAVLRWLSWGIFGVVVAVWAVVGAIVWIPLLIRTMVRFSLALVPATLNGEHPTRAAERLQAAVDFYRRGFVTAAAAVHGRVPARSDAPRRPAGSGHLAREFAWAALIWYVVLALFGVVGSPVDAGRWLVALPWNEWAVGLGAWIVEPFERL